MTKTKGSKNKKVTVVSEKSKNPILTENIHEEITEKVNEEQENEIHEIAERMVKDAFYSYMRGNDPQVIGRAWEKFKHHLK